MNLKTINYTDYKNQVPQTGQHILAQQHPETIIVYQAYNAAIADYAIKHQQFGGNAFSFNRMTWVKPNFLWMMYRCGWALKENQENILAVKINRTFFDEILEQAVYSSFNPNVYKNREDWQQQMNKSEVRLQWDPDHDPHGNKQERRAIQLGMKGNIMKKYCTEAILEIENITDFVKEQYQYVKNNMLHKLLVPEETVYKPTDTGTCKKPALTEINILK